MGPSLTGVIEWAPRPSVVGILEPQQGADVSNMGEGPHVANRWSLSPVRKWPLGSKGWGAAQYGVLEPEERDKEIQTEGHWPNGRCQILSGVRRYLLILKTYTAYSGNFVITCAPNAPLFHFFSENFTKLTFLMCLFKNMKLLFILIYHMKFLRHVNLIKATSPS